MQYFYKRSHTDENKNLFIEPNAGWGIRSFQKNATFLRSFAFFSKERKVLAFRTLHSLLSFMFLIKRMWRSLHSFMFFIKERAFFVFFYIIFKRTWRSLHSFTFFTKECKRTLHSFWFNPLVPEIFFANFFMKI